MFSVRLEKNQKWGFSQSKCKPPVFTNEKKKVKCKKRAMYQATGWKRRGPHGHSEATTGDKATTQ